MHRITISFPNPVFEELEKIARQKDISIAEYIRQLIEMGRRMEEAALIQSCISTLESAKKLPAHTDANFWEHNLSWVLESRYLLRYLIDNMTHQSTEQRQAVLNTAAEKARKWVVEFMGEKP